MDNEITSFDEYLKKYNIKKEEPETDVNIEYESEVEVLGNEIKEIEEVFGSEEKQQEIFKVRVLVGRLRYFSGPGTNYVEFGTAKKGDEFIIVEETTGIGALKWGRMKTQDAWIPLDYCERLGIS